MSADLMEIEQEIMSFCGTAYRLAENKAWRTEAKALELILARVWLALPVASDVKEIHIIDRISKSETGPNSGFTVTDKLTFHVEGQLSRSFVVTQRDNGRSLETKIEEFDLDYRHAVGLYGLEAICTGLLEALRGQNKGNARESQDRLRQALALVEVLEKELDVEIALHSA